MTATPVHRNGRATRVGVGLVRADLRRYLLGAAIWAAWWAAPALIGLLLQAAFDAVTGDAAAGLTFPTAIALLVAVEAGRLGVFFSAFLVWARWWARMQALLRTNLLRAQLASGGEGAGRPVQGAGASIAVFRDDVQDVIEYVDGWVDLTGTLGFATVALVVMARVDLALTLVVALPLVAVFVVTRVLAERLRRVRLADRQATARVTGLLGDLFSAVLAVKVAGAEERAVRRLRQLNAARLRTSLRDKVLEQVLEAFNSSTVDVTIGLVLLLVAGQMRAGEFTVGDLALFTSYLSWLAGLPRWAGLVLTRHRHAQVAVRRMARLLPGDDETQAVRPRPLHLDRPYTPPTLPRAATPAPPAITLRGFGVRHPGGGGVHGVDLDLPAGSFTVVRGPVGAGKSTLLRGLLGLAGEVEGTVTWDGEPVTDLAAHFVPPRAAYVPQVPRLFSATLRDNLLLGRQTSDDVLAAALRAAAFDADVAEMPDGVATVCLLYTSDAADE